MNRIALLVSIFLMGIALFACAPKSLPVEKLETRQALLQELQAPAKEAWEAEWDRTLAAAKKEGRVTVSTGRGPQVREAISEAFEKKYGIKVEWIVGPPGGLAAKILAERKAGIYSLDINQEGAQPFFVMLKPHNIFDPILLSLILPEVKDEKAFWQGKYPLADGDGVSWAMCQYIQEPLEINTDLVKIEEIVSYKDLLRPEWKGKIVMGDPTTGAGGPAKWFAVMVHEPFGPILGIDYMKELVKQKPMVIRDNRLGMEWLLRGKYAMGLSMTGKTIRREWAKQGIRVPIVSHTPKEGGYLTSGGTMISIMNKAPHPNAARIFLNWLFSREGQIIYSKVQGQQSTRIDIPPPEEIGPDMSLRVPGVKYVNSDDEDFILQATKYVPISREVFGPLLQ